MINTKFSKKQFPIAGALIILGSLASAPIANAGGPDQQPVVQQATQNIFYCPPISALVKNPETRTWSAADKWKSYDLSFVDKVTQFAGAQWKGTNVGQIFCLYRGEESTSFPILLAYSVLTYMPQGGKWSEDLGGYKNCVSTEREECPFSIRIKPKEENLYEQAEKLRKPSQKSTHPGF